METAELFGTLCPEGAFVKMVFSKAADPNERRMTVTPFLHKGVLTLQCERLMTDGKALHENLPADRAAAVLTERCGTSYRQINVFGNDGTEWQILYSKKGRASILKKRGAAAGGAPAPLTHDKVKKHFLNDPAALSFLVPLGIADASGKILDRMRPKYRQINRFLELLDDVYAKLPQDGTLCVYDLCCGKSYLSFAVYFYLTAVRKRAVRMYGIDRKADVIAYCEGVAKSAGYDGLLFTAGDISTCLPEEKPHLVISLHACDIATDLVLRCAARRGADVILSTPCCHHEMFHTMDTSRVPFLGEYSILKQKLADAATDALRCKWLEAHGYRTEAVELVDPEETPKNVMIRAIREKHPTKAVLEQRRREYLEGCAFFGVEPALYPYLDEDTDPAAAASREESHN